VRFEFAYEDGNMLVCPECAHEGPRMRQRRGRHAGRADSNGNVLQDGDTVTVIKDLKVKGSSLVVKVGPRSRISASSKEIMTSTADRRHRRDAAEIGICQEGVRTSCQAFGTSMKNGAEAPFFIVAASVSLVV